jgi:tetratricopeptide (TPR) repeat protein
VLKTCLDIEISEVFMKKLLIAVFLVVFFICSSSANAAQDLKNVIDAKQKSSGQDTDTAPGIKANQAAAAHAQEFIQVNSNSGATEDLANAYEIDGKKDDAKNVWETLLAKNANDTGLYVRYSEALNRMGDVNGAIAQLKKAQQLDPSIPFYTFRMADILAANNKQNEAKAILTKLINEAKDSWVKENAKTRLEQIGTGN